MRNLDKESAPPLGPPPRRARLRRGVRNLRHAYRMVFLLIILVFGGWAVLDGIRLYEWTYSPGAEQLSQENWYARTYALFMMVSCGLAALIALAVFVWSERGLRRDLHLARHGEVVQGHILATGKGRRKRSRAWIAYMFCTSAGVAVQGRCVVPRTTPTELRAVGMAIEILYEAAQPQFNKARMGLDFIEFD